MSTIHSKQSITTQNNTIQRKALQQQLRYLEDLPVKTTQQLLQIQLLKLKIKTLEV